MDWVDALFLHWPVEPAQLRARVPAELALDTFDGAAWVGVVAFRIAGARLRGFPPALGWRAFPEVNVRTYVTGGGRPGVWFFSLDAASGAAVEAGRRIVHLPYTRAEIDVRFGATSAAYRLIRTDGRAPAARFAAEATFEGPPRSAEAGARERFLVERLAFFTTDRRGRVRRGDVLHDPWPLRDASVRIAENGLLAAAGIVPSSPGPLAHVSSGVATRAWRPR